MLRHLILFYTVLQVVTSQDCSPASVTVCLKAFVGSRVIDPSVPTIDADVPAWNETFSQLKERCQRFGRFSTCMATVLPSCPLNSTQLFTGWNNAYNNLLCPTDSGLQKFVQYEQCYGQPELLTGTQFCNNTYFAKLASLSTTPKSQVVSSFCSYTDNYLDCLKTAVAEQCNKNASDWLYEWNQALRQTQMSDYSCPGWQIDSASDNSVTTLTIIIAVSLGFTLIIVIAGIVVIVVLTKRKKKTPVRRSSMMPPPPYTTNPAMMFGAEAGPDGESSVTAVGPSWGTDTLFKFPVVQPPPYGDSTAPAYDNANVDTAATGATASVGEVNSGFNRETSYEELGAVGGTSSPAGPSLATTSAATEAVTESERELNTAWF